VAVLALAVGLVTLPRTNRETRQAEAVDRESAGWLATYPDRILSLNIATEALVTPLKAHDYAALVPRCEVALQDAQALDGAAAALPAGMGSRLHGELQAFVAETHEAFQACVDGSQRRDWSYLKTHMEPVITRAAGLASQIVGLATYH
jgi:hypothetical protein